MRPRPETVNGSWLCIPIPEQQRPVSKPTGGYFALAFAWRRVLGLAPLTGYEISAESPRFEFE
ncbi:MAG: hypothetical protein NZ483_05695 [Verrucomicrobiae bacterium]|nr:hypothetical protein [Verrucomicrobiae bacterium]MDW8343180.1 hypothetical protein [Verrucomicrobiae bacterium]